MTLKMILAFLISLFVAVLIGSALVPFLRKIKAGQEIREDGPIWHKSKAGTPTMGGIIFICGVTAACLAVGWTEMLRGEFGHIFVLLFALIFGAIGFLDDYEKLKKKQNLGLKAKQKFLLQLVVAIAFVFLMRKFGYATPNLYIPFWNITVPVPEVVYFIFAAFIIVGCVNAVNLTDGVDGLATGTTLPVMLCYAVIAFRWGQEFLSLGIFASGLFGGLMGFLLYNYNPAKIFMGDTGSLFLGGAVCGLAFAMDMPLVLIPLGIIYIAETLSDIIQVLYFKISHGKRIFKMAPLHHHLEMGGWTGKKWTEKELFALFTGISLLFAIISFIGVAGRYVM
ncbi:MAG: phospho-N-acetylmuramoyl-pentapeptide-transferase [Oscillospiraceae bacterium]|nr:phospho-N-acetylmuramoyl-pentapeptide-transferase [Oscillospiraceae bacterium]